MNQFADSQIRDLIDLQTACAAHGAALVLIGAMAYRIFGDATSFTEDVDTAVALELDEFSRLAADLQQRGWKQDATREERWYGPNRTRVDIIPAGTQLRSEGKVIWPRGEMTMSLIGFDHVFEDSVEVRVSDDLRIKVIPLPVLVLLKILAYLDDQFRREKDLQHIGQLLTDYESDGDRRFGADVLEAGCTFQSAGAYLLGVDVGALCTGAEADLVESFLDKVRQEGPAYAAIHRTRRLSDEVFHRDLDDQIRAFGEGLRRSSRGPAT